MSVTYRPVVGVEGYRVGDDGTVYSCWKPAGPGRVKMSNEWHQLKPKATKFGHLHVNLGRKIDRYVHALVLEAFVSPCPDGMECCHADDDPKNNRLINLSWGTHASNVAQCTGRRRHAFGERNGRRKLSQADVAELRAAMVSGTSVSKAAADAGVSVRHARAIKSNRYWRTSCA